MDPSRNASKKVFCVGLNKTGTTSLAAALGNLGFRLGDQPSAELLIDSWAVREFDPIVSYCRDADAFQDVPFSLDYTYQAVDQAFPGSKFILTVRESPEVWFRSLVEFHARMFGGGRTPTAADLARADYRYQGWALKTVKSMFSLSEEPLYDEARLISRYREHNEMIRRYFWSRPDDLLELDLREEDSMDRLCAFLGVEPTGEPMPWEMP
jgi:hypothetical protein